MPGIATTTGQSRRQRYLILKEALFNERSSFDSHWRDITTNIRPRRERFAVTDKNKGDRRNQHIIDSTASFALRTLQSGLQAGLTSPARPWFKLTTPDPDLAELGPVKEWLHTVTQRMQIVMVRSNIYNTLATAYGDYAMFGTTAIGVFADPETVMRAVCYPIGSYAGSVDGRGRLSTFVREFDLTVEQVVEEYGGPNGDPLAPGAQPDLARFSTTVSDAWARGNRQSPVTVIQVVQRNRDYDANATDAHQWPIVSCHFEQARRDTADDVFLRESGFRESAIMMPRWDVMPEDTYGTDCPGMTALGDIRQLYLMQKEKGKAIQKMVNPPVTAPSHVRGQAVSLLPGDITYVDVREGQQGIKPIHETRFPIAELVQDIQDVRGMIRRAFYEDLFLMLAQDDRAQPVTAREIDERHEEKLIALGPVLERTNDELLDPLISRTYQLMNEAGMIPPPPQAVRNVALSVQYVSLMAQAQKLVGIAAQDRFFQSFGMIAQVFPEARFKVDPFEVVDEYAGLIGVNPKIIRPSDDARASAQQQADAQARAQRQVEMESAAKSAQALGNTPVSGDNALGRMLGAVAP